MTVANLIDAANSGVTAGEYKPHNCHEAVLGWVLRAKYPALRVAGRLTKGVAGAWLTLRSLSERYGTGSPKQLTGQWMARNI